MTLAALYSSTIPSQVLRFACCKSFCESSRENRARLVLRSKGVTHLSHSSLSLVKRHSLVLHYHFAPRDLDLQAKIMTLKREQVALLRSPLQVAAELNSLAEEQQGPHVVVSYENHVLRAKVNEIAEEALRISQSKFPLSSFQSGTRLNKFVRRLHNMLKAEKDNGLVEWRKGLLVIHSTAVFAKTILPKYFNTRNFKTFRRQLNYYGFVHVRSFSTSGSSTTALWVNQALTRLPNADDVGCVLTLKRVEPATASHSSSEESSSASPPAPRKGTGMTMVEARRARKEKALHTVEQDIGVSTNLLQLNHRIYSSPPSLPMTIEMIRDNNTHMNNNNNNTQSLEKTTPAQAASLLLLLSNRN